MAWRPSGEGVDGAKLLGVNRIRVPSGEDDKFASVGSIRPMMRLDHPSGKHHWRRADAILRVPPVRIVFE